MGQVHATWCRGGAAAPATLDREQLGTAALPRTPAKALPSFRIETPRSDVAASSEDSLPTAPSEPASSPARSEDAGDAEARPNRHQLLPTGPTGSEGALHEQTEQETAAPIQPAAGAQRAEHAEPEQAQPERALPKQAKPVPSWRLAAETLEAERAKRTRDVVRASTPASQSTAADWDDISAGVLEWLVEVTGAKLPEGTKLPLDEVAAHALLRSGTVLCELVNRLHEGSVPVIERSDAPFPQRENIARFIGAASALGVLGHELFQTEDLFSSRDMKQVVLCIAALGRTSHAIAGYDGPTLGKPERARLGAHKRSQHVVAVGQGRWGTAAGQHRPGGPAGGERGTRPASATGFLSPSAPAA
jgi:hypothetical protein